MGRVGAADTAFGPRPQYLVGVEANWDEGDDDANIAWARQVVTDLGRFSRGGSYLNFPGFFEEGAAPPLRVWRADYQRLQEVRSRLDPDDVFARPE